ncbi:MAG: hypothetical protein ABII12_03665 [Planctomycetota bacterium]
MTLSRCISAKSVLTGAAICALLLLAPTADAATLDISHLISYITQTDTTATGVIEVTLSYGGPDAGDPGQYDLFLSQLMVTRAGSSAGLTLDTAATSDTSTIPNYWLAGRSTFPSAFSPGGQFHFDDFTMGGSVYPQVGDVVARYVINFEASSTAEFGDYAIELGDQNQNQFYDTVFNPPFDNATSPSSVGFTIIPEPATGLLLIATALPLLRRRRR